MPSPEGLKTDDEKMRSQLETYIREHELSFRHVERVYADALQSEDIPTVTNIDLQQHMQRMFDRKFPLNQIVEIAKNMRKEYVALAKELSESKEVFPFPGMDPYSYTGAKKTDEEFPGLTTDTDILIGRMKKEGIRIVLTMGEGMDAASGNVYILPAGESDVLYDGMFPNQLASNMITDKRLRRLSLLEKIM